MKNVIDARNDCSLPRMPEDASRTSIHSSRFGAFGFAASFLVMRDLQEQKNSDVLLQASDSFPLF